MDFNLFWFWMILGGAIVASLAAWDLFWQWRDTQPEKDDPKYYPEGYRWWKWWM